MEQFSSARVTLVVPKQQVKTVKQALERIGYLDRSSKITFESRNEGRDQIIADPVLSRHDGDRHESDRSPSGTLVATPIAVPTPSSSTQQTRLPKSQFDTISNTYIDSELLQGKFNRGDQVATDQGPSPSLTAKTFGDRDDQIAFPPLRFDVAKRVHIGPSYRHSEEGAREKTEQQRMCIPTTIPYPIQTDGSVRILDAKEINDLKLSVLQDLALSALSHNISLSHHATADTLAVQRVRRNPVQRALWEALRCVLEQLPSSHAITVEALVSAFPDGYSVYSPMLLLPHNTFSTTPWKTFMATHPVDSVAMRSVWQGLAEVVGATHVAVNAPIPLSTTATSISPARMAIRENILRSPVNITPLHGEFGNAPTPQTISAPTVTDFANALWVTTRQNGIWQTWAPLYTMFSRGNIREKMRILNLPSLTASIDTASAAADLYAGIGYFAFSYKKSGEALEKGIKQVLCWELNPWSVEGLRRGAEMNGWTCRVLKQDDLWQLRQMGQTDDSDLDDADFVVFQTSNESADLDYSLLRSQRLPVRHVNLGLLPSSRLSWRVAVAVLDTKRGGWIHVHENVSIKHVETMRQNMERTFQKLVCTMDSERGEKVSVVHVERVKM
ncbi:tRNA wybutosine-synthesizing protein 2 [Alternaria panax]|uniref:tRNA(Phe) (4-demethylwyosine(37)-C(7)) aminocarboxypropyltransferase n=1 Tax=Alternaria panax TaxID=48097 RepID=A0AAD4NSS5_9PLEO|nr:tRNA wybutosine-synthesizing protein 2 [Alternaria panax]